MPERVHAAVIERELEWFYRTLETRLRLHFNQETSHRSIADLPPPELNGDPGAYARLVAEHDFCPSERLVLALALAPHLRPALLDPLF
ncbi:MAG: ATP-binding protein, partial [Verrucomicrobiae bacterium]|nr:ATP-binding protein [Verrucomicrobiae bacterium]